MPIVSSVDGSILTLEIIDPGLNYEVPPSISNIDKTRHGGGAHAEAIVDDLGRIVDIFMLAPGEGYCPSTNVVPPQYPVTEGPAPLDDGEIPPYNFLSIHNAHFELMMRLVYKLPLPFQLHSVKQ